ncbi:carboxypeptidase regulatory-like domain-containing protein [candidate division KSB1 bacterium]|nr:carboxypeptidase regulatory-like domain-containing protein [candidate division KSB1 bacterium]
MKNLLNFILVVSLIFGGCWKKQTHEVEEPETPRYDIKGLITDMDSADPVKNIVVDLEVITLFHETEFVPLSDTTDTSGVYLFKDIVPGRYTLSIQRGGYVVEEKEIVQQYEPRTLDFEVAKPLVSQTFYPVPSYFAFLGIHWKYVDKLAGATYWRPHTDNRFLLRIAEGSFKQGFEVMGQTRYWPENPDFHGLTFIRNYWAASVQSPNYMYEITPGDSKVISQTAISWELSDLTTDGSHIWAAARNGKIIQFGQHPSVVAKVYELTDEHFGGIAWDGKNIWTSNPNKNLIMKRGADMSILETYRPIVTDDFRQPIEGAEMDYLCFDHNGYLWAATSVGTCHFEKK